jgi:tripartite-type tricarboxylate transporter receptor subunit TctC
MFASSFPRALLLTTSLALSALPAFAADAFPSKTINVIHGFGAGGGIDVMARMAIMNASDVFKVPIIVVPMPGAATVEATRYIQKQPADGYTVFATTPTSTLINPLAGRVSVMPDDWIPLLRAHIDVSSLMVRQDSPFKTWDDCVAYAKSNPGKLKLGIMGAMSVDELASAAVLQQAGITMKLIPYESGGEGHAALLGGHVDLLFEEPGVVTQLVDGKKLRPILLLTQQRIEKFPDVACLGDYKYTGVPVLWRGFFVKKGTPDAIVKILEEGLTASMQSKTYQKYEADSLLNIYPGGFQNSKEFGKSFKEDAAAFRSVMQKLGYLKAAQ